MTSIARTEVSPSYPSEEWVVRHHYADDGTLLLIDTAPANLAGVNETPMGEYSNRQTRRALVKAGLRERVERLKH